MERPWITPAATPATVPPLTPPIRAQYSTSSTMRILPRDTPPKVSWEKDSTTSPADTVRAATSLLSYTRLDRALPSPVRPRSRFPARRRK